MTFDGFFDDAALFPPGNASMPEAVRQHLARRAGPDGRFVGPFVCPADRLDELGRALEGGRLRVALVGPPRGPVPEGVTLVAVEVFAPASASPGLPPDVRIAVERSWDGCFKIPSGALLKLRCGGAVVPSVGQLADAVRHCVAHAQPFKVTAGLHHAIRAGDAHGFVNIMAAVNAARAGEDPAPVLAETRAECLDLADLGSARTLFRSIGTCSIEDPLTDLRALGLVA